MYKHLLSSSLLSSSLLVGALVAGTASSAYAAPKDGAEAPDLDRPKTGYVMADPSMVNVLTEPDEVLHHGGNTIFLNGCFNGGCTISPGSESSISNRSSIIGSTVVVPPFSEGQFVWDAMVECVRDTYAPFGIVITDVDPGNSPHYEGIVAGSPTDIGQPNGVGGVAPFSCGVIQNAITYSFAEVYGSNVDALCWTVAQETAHAFGLDHEFLCSDPMTYLSGCGDSKRFQDQNAQCGEFQARACQCGGSTQNSFQRINTLFGNSTPTPPELEITAPADGAFVSAGFPIRATASDDNGIDKVDLLINGNFIGSVDSEPYVFNAPTELSDGVMTIQLTAVDTLGARTTKTIEVTQGLPCESSSSCGDREVCVEGSCVAGPEINGGLGTACVNNEDCISNICARSGEGDYCAESCTPGGGGCPGGFVCQDLGNGSGVCWASDDDGGGCSVSAGGKSGTSPLFWLGTVAILFGLRRRRQ